MITTRVIPAVHRRCAALTLMGVVEGLPARVDLAALNRTGEIAALLDGLTTYTLTGGELAYRDAGRIAAGKLRGPVLAQHSCHRTIPAHHRAATPPAPVADPERIPF